MCFWYNEFKVEDFMEVNRNSSEYCIRFFYSYLYTILHDTVMDSEDVKVHNAEGEKVIKSVEQGTIGSSIHCSFTFRLFSIDVFENSTAHFEANRLRNVFIFVFGFVSTPSAT